MRYRQQASHSSRSTLACRYSRHKCRLRQACIARAAENGDTPQQQESEQPVEFRDELGELSEKLDVVLKSCDAKLKVRISCSRP